MSGCSGVCLSVSIQKRCNGQTDRAEMFYLVQIFMFDNFSSLRYAKYLLSPKLFFKPIGETVLKILFNEKKNVYKPKFYNVMYSVHLGF